MSCGKFGQPLQCLLFQNHRKLTLQLKIMSKFLSNKKLLAIIILWTFLNIIFLSISHADYYKSDLWSFTKNDLTETYDITEFLLYVFGPIVIATTYSLFKNNENEK